MSALDLDEIVIPSLRVISPTTAARDGYIEITVGIHHIRDAHLFQSIQSSLKSVNAVWIEKSGGYFAAARKAADLREITEIEALVSVDARRDSNREEAK